MENLRSDKTRTRRSAAACVMIAVFVCTALAAAFSFGGFGAYADNNSSIGSGGGTLEVKDVSEYPVVAGFNDAYRGVTLRISAPQSVTGIYIAYDVDASNTDDSQLVDDLWSWAIKGDDVEDSEIPYMKVTGAGSVTREDEGSYFDAEWSEIETVNSTKRLTVTVHINGELNVMCTLDGENPMYANYIVRNVDWEPPTVKADKYGNLVAAYRITESDGSYALNCSASFTDRQFGAFGSGYSGIGYAEVFYTDTELTTDDIPEGSEGPEMHPVASYDKFPEGTAQIDFTLEFAIKSDGYYYYYVIDRVGNQEMGPLFGYKVEISVDERFTVQSVGNNGHVSTLNVEENMINYGAEIENNKDKVNAALYEKAYAAYSALMLSFMSSSPGASEQYFAFVSGELKEFKDAYRNGATYEVEIVNDDLLFGEIKVLNLDSAAVEALGGDIVKVKITVARFEADNYDGGKASALSGIGNARYVYRLVYELSVNGVVSAIPESALIFNIEVPEKVTAVALLVGSQDGYESKNFSYGVSWMRFETSLNNATYYLVTEENDDGDGSGLLPLWITLGALGGVALAAAIAVAVLYATGKLPRSKKVAEDTGNESSEAKDGADAETEVPANTRTPSNKSKKKKKRK